MAHKIRKIWQSNVGRTQAKCCSKNVYTLARWMLHSNLSHFPTYSYRIDIGLYKESFTKPNYLNYFDFLALRHVEIEAGRGHSKLNSPGIAQIVSSGIYFNGSKLFSAIESKWAERKWRNHPRRRTENTHSKWGCTEGVYGP